MLVVLKLRFILPEGVAVGSAESSPGLLCMRTFSEMLALSALQCCAKFMRRLTFLFRASEKTYVFPFSNLLLPSRMVVLISF